MLEEGTLLLADPAPLLRHLQTTLNPSKEPLCIKSNYSMQLHVSFGWKFQNLVGG